MDRMTPGETAPFFDEVAEGPPGGVARWIHAADGVRLRVVHWPLDGARATVLLFPGRTEYAEKYGRAAKELAARGLATLVIDWRGQGLADRVAGDPALGHVARFQDYQMDVAALIEALPGFGITGDLVLLAHSMGGAIGLRALHRGLPVAAAAFTAPMWGIELPLPLRPLAWTLSGGAGLLGLSEMLSPGTRAETYVLQQAFGTNKLTTDADMYAYLRAQATAHPELMIGGPTMKWLNESLREMLRLARMPSPGTPCLTFLGTREEIVSAARIRRRMAAWPRGRLEMVEGARHEVMMEGPETRRQVFDQCAAHYAAHLERTGAAAPAG